MAQHLNQHWFNSSYAWLYMYDAPIVPVQRLRREKFRLVRLKCVRPNDEETNPGRGTSILGSTGDVPLDRVPFWTSSFGTGCLFWASRIGTGSYFGLPTLGSRLACIHCLHDFAHKQDSQLNSSVLITVWRVVIEVWQDSQLNSSAFSHCSVWRFA